MSSLDVNTCINTAGTLPNDHEQSRQYSEVPLDVYYVARARALAQRIFDTLGGYGTPPDSFWCICPNDHDKWNPTCGVTLDGARLGLLCLRGCTRRAIVAGLKRHDLWFPPNSVIGR
jgi:hypothetical protein